MKRAVFVIMCAILVLLSLNCEGAGKMTEVRALWVVRWDIASPEACHNVVKLAKEYNFNTLFVQVRGRGDAFYKSHYEPRAQDLDGQSNDFDPLAVIIKEGHEAGLQIHAWINANYTWGSNKPPVSPEHIVNKHPDWLMRTADNELVMTGGDDVEGAYTCPSNEEWREMHKNIYLDIISQYNVDGVHFDFIRYPSTRFCYCDRCLKQFEAEINEEITPEKKLELCNDPDRKLVYTRVFPDKWDDFRRTQITKMVYTVYDAVKKAKPNVIVSAAVFPGYNDAYNHRFQDWKRWMKDHKLDMLCPMSYVTNMDSFTRQIKDAVEASGGIPVVAGIGVWQITPEKSIEQIAKERELGGAGFNLFSYTTLTGDDGTKYAQLLREKAFPKAEYLPLVGEEKK